MYNQTAMGKCLYKHKAANVLYSFFIAIEIKDITQLDIEFMALSIEQGSSVGSV